MKFRKFTVYSIIVILLFVLSGCSVKADKINIEPVPTMKVNDTHQLTYTLEPDNVTDKTVYYESSDENIVSIDNQGLIKALNPGEAKIIVYANNGKKDAANDSKVKSEITVSVIQPVASIKMETELTLPVGKSGNTNTIIFPENASDKTLVYSSSDESIATVSDDGIITGIKKGTVIISCISLNDIKAECSVNIKQPISGISLNKSNIYLTVNNTETLNVTFTPADADFNTETIFSSSNNSVATVNPSGEITAVAQGNATLTAEAKDVDGNPLTATCEIQVSQPKIANENSSSTTATPSNTQSTKQFIIAERDLPCPGCSDLGYMMTGCPCYICDYWEKRNNQ